MQHLITVAVDPGKYHAGWAIFVDGKLTIAGVTQYAPEPNTHGPEYRNPLFRQGESQIGVKVAEAIIAQLRRVFHAVKALDPMPDLCSFRVEYVAEYPHVYVDPKTRQLKKGSNPQALMPLALMSGLIAGAVAAFCAFVRVRYVEPGEWKHSRSDEATWTWVRKALDAGEKAIAQACNVYDDETSAAFHHGLEACGIGMWSLFRI